MTLRSREAWSARTVARHPAQLRRWGRISSSSSALAAGLLGKQAAQLAPKSHNVLNTAAAAEVEVGELSAGKEHLDASMDVNDVPLPEDADLYVHGRLLEQLGFVDDAIAVYRRIKPDTGINFVPNCGELAQRRLKALGVKK